MISHSGWKGEIELMLKSGKRITFLGVGRIFQGDDAAGTILISRLNSKYKGINLPSIQFLPAGEMPENFTGKIRDFQPEEVWIFDAADMKISPGGVDLIEPTEIIEGGMTSHKLPLTILFRYIGETIGCKVRIIGIQPEVVRENEKMSKTVGRSVRSLQRLLGGFIEKYCWKTIRQKK